MTTEDSRTAGTGTSPPARAGRATTRGDAEAGTGAAAPAYPWRWLALALLLTAEAMNLLDATIVQIAAPVIHAGLGGAESDIQWFSAAYTLPFAVLLVVGGRLGDIYGRERVFLAGVAGFAVSSTACALAPTAGVLIGARAVQGAAAALIIPQTFGLIKAMFDGDELARALGSIGPVMGLSAICGPALGALLTRADLFGSSWRSVFLVNLPLAVAVLAAGRLLREDRGTVRPRLDLAGTALAVLGVGMITYPLIEGGERLWSWVAVAGGFVVLAGLVGHQRAAARHGRGTLVEPSLFAQRGFPAALLTSTLFFAVMNGLMLVIVLQLQLGLGRDAFTAGLTLVPWSAGSAVASLTAGRWLVPRFGGRVMFAGLGTLVVGCGLVVAVYHRVGPGTYPRLLPAALAVCGVGLGLFTVPFFTAALGRVRPHETGSAAGLLNAVQQLGATLGVAVLGSVFLHGMPADGPAGEPGRGPAGAASLLAAQHVFWVAIALTAATAVTATAMRVGPARRETASPPPPGG